METGRPGRGPPTAQGRDDWGSAQSTLTGAICVHLDAQDPDVGAPDAHAHPVAAPAGGQAKLLDGVDAHDGDPVPRDDLVTQVPERRMGRKKVRGWWGQGAPGSPGPVTLAARPPRHLYTRPHGLAPAPAPPRAPSLSPQPSPCLDGPTAGRRTGLGHGGGLTPPPASRARPLCWLELGGAHPSPSGAPPPSQLLSDALQGPPWPSRGKPSSSRPPSLPARATPRFCLFYGSTSSVKSFCLWILISSLRRKKTLRDIPGGPVVKNPPSNAGDTGSIPGWGTKIPHAAGQLRPRATTTELARHNQTEA